MQAIMISIKPKWCAKIMNGEKTIEVRKSKALASAIQKLIDENGYAEIYVYCSKGKPYLFSKWVRDLAFWQERDINKEDTLNGKVLFKFRCYKVEEIEDFIDLLSTQALNCIELLQKSCLTFEELHDYLPFKDDDSPRGYAIHISDLEIFNEPKELSEFKTYKTYNLGDLHNCHVSLTRAPQNMVYVEVEK